MKRSLKVCRKCDHYTRINRGKDRRMAFKCYKTGISHEDEIRYCKYSPPSTCEYKFEHLVLSSSKENREK